VPNAGVTVCVIVPVLNAEDTLAEALDSVVAQTIFARVRTIVVENGSTDGSAEIAAAYAERHGNITVIRHIGGGCGGARNAALPLALEPYVAFLDADDILPSTSLERRVDLMERSGADILVGAMETFPDIRSYTPDPLYAEDRILEGLAEAPQLVDIANVTNKLFRRSYFDAPGNLFLEDVSFEDVTITMRALVEARRIAVLSEVCYRYRKDPSATTIMTHALVKPSNFWDHLRINALVHERLADDPAGSALVDRYLIRSIRRFLVHAPQRLSPEDLRQFFDEARELYGHYPVSLLAEHMTKASWTMAFYALLADDFELFRDPDSHILGVELVDGHPHLQIDRPVEPRLRPLLRIPPPANLRDGTLASGNGGTNLNVSAPRRSAQRLRTAATRFVRRPG
jgi:glycosyltransferase involved in cell wall biosynthesis